MPRGQQTSSPVLIHALQREVARWEGFRDSARTDEDRRQAEIVLKALRGESESALRIDDIVEEIDADAERLRRVVEKHGTSEAKARLAAQTRLNGA